MLLAGKVQGRHGKSHPTHTLCFSNFQFPKLIQFHFFRIEITFLSPCRRPHSHPLDHERIWIVLNLQA